MNWVLYTAPPPGVDAALRVDLPTSLPPGTLTDALHSHLAHVAEELLPSYWGDLVRLTTPEELALQPMYDFTAPRYATGRFLLAGDAATVARPHTGAGAVKALQDGAALESALRSAADVDEALAAYDDSRTAMRRCAGRARAEPGPGTRAGDPRLAGVGPGRARGMVGTGGRNRGVRRETAGFRHRPASPLSTRFVVCVR